MSLQIYLLGQFKLCAHDKPIELPSRPAQSLLAYLALNAGIAQRREKLAGLLWPEATESNARAYLRQGLWRIRKCLETGGLDPKDYLTISDIQVIFDERSDYWLDARQLREAAPAEQIESLTEGLRLYRGELLPGFYEEWATRERDRLQVVYRQKMKSLLEALTRAERWSEVLEWGEAWIRLSEAPEPAFRALMHAYAKLGDQASVGATYRRCVDTLQGELGVRPAAETTQLYEQALQRGVEQVEPPAWSAPDEAVRAPAFLDDLDPHRTEAPVFVARARELDQLRSHLEAAVAGQGRVVFITGEAGSGKTSLIQEFIRRSQAAREDLIIAGGNCNAHTGMGDPYLPFREILELLAGDIESRWAAGAMGGEYARRLWRVFPRTAQALTDCGEGLIDVLVSGRALRERALTYAPAQAKWLSRLKLREMLPPTSPVHHSPQQSDLFEQYTRVVQALAQESPLVLALDDLQWVDPGSISLLFHLGRRLAGTRILILGAYRPEEVALGRQGERHPLEALVHEFQRLVGDILVDLHQAERQGFVEALLDSEPNRLDAPFREMLYKRTRGHPLFTIELLRGLQERGDLAQDPQGRWITGRSLDWEKLPARVEAVIAERMSRLAQPLQEALRVACIEGEVFSAEVVARVQGAGERETVRRLSDELDRKHGLARAQSILRLGGRRISRYRFRNYLFQHYLYHNLDAVERAYLHEAVGDVLAEIYGDQASEIAVQLAWHYQEAQVSEKAVAYLRQAGERALHLSAYQESITHLTQALALLESQADTPERANNEIAIQLAYGLAMESVQGFGPAVKKAFYRARELCQQLGKRAQLCQVLGEMAISYYVAAEHRQARELAEQALSLAESVEDPLLVAASHWRLGFISFALGEYNTARRYLEQVIEFYNPAEHHSAFVAMRGSDVGAGAFAYYACSLWCLGFPDQATQRSQEGLQLAYELEHPFTLVDVLSFGGCMFNVMRRDLQAADCYSEEFEKLARNKLPSWAVQSNWQRGEVLAMTGQLEAGIAKMEEAFARHNQERESCYLTGCLRSLAEAQAKVGRAADAWRTLEAALALVERTSERHWEAELQRLKGRLLLAQGDEAGAQASFNRAIEIARKQAAKSWELRAAIDLARLWQQQGKTAAAKNLLGEIYGWFTEGFDTPDLVQARLLLEELTN